MMYVYILSGKDTGQLYVGATENLRRRIREHRKGYCISSTARCGIHKNLIHWWNVADRYTALKLESYLQSLQRAGQEDLLGHIILDCPIATELLLSEAYRRPDTPYQSRVKLINKPLN